MKAAGIILDKEDLIKKVWPDTFVEEVSLAKKVSILRKVLGEDVDHHYIETIPRRGYRFVANVREVWQEDSATIGPRAANGTGQEPETTEGELNESLEPARSFPRPEPRGFHRARARAPAAGGGWRLCCQLVCWSVLECGNGISGRPRTR